MTAPDNFDLRDFTPYLLNIAAETTSLEFQKIYKGTYGMLRTEWRVVFHLGRYGPMTAKQICDRARLHKTKVSRAVSALERKRYLSRKQMTEDKRHETLSLTRSGQAVFEDLYSSAQAFDIELMSDFTDEEQQILRRCLTRLSQL